MAGAQMCVKPAGELHCGGRVLQADKGRNAQAALQQDNMQVAQHGAVCMQVRCSGARTSKPSPGTSTELAYMPHTPPPTRLNTWLLPAWAAPSAAWPWCIRAGPGHRACVLLRCLTGC